MTRYISLIRKQDFANLYKYGTFHANKDLVIEVVGDIEHIRSCQDYFTEITKLANPFESTFTYLFVYYQKTDEESRYYDIEIENVLNLFPLDNEAKTLLEEDFGPQIRFEEPLWPNAVELLRINQQIMDCKKGVSNIWKIFELDNAALSECKSILQDNIIKEVVTEKYRNIRPSGNLPVWAYLLRYERHSMYPNTTLGFYMDAVHSLLNYSQKKEHQSIEVSTIFQFLDKMDYNSQTNQISYAVQNSPETKKFFDFAKNVVEGYDFMLVATIFFKLKSLYKEKFIYEKEFIDSCIAKWPKDFALAAYLLGWILGHGRTYASLYNKYPLHIIKKTENIKTIPSTIKVVDNVKSAHLEENTKDILLPFEKEDTQSHIDLPVRMGKKVKTGPNKGKIAKTPKPKEVKTKEEYESLLLEGWIIIE